MSASGARSTTSSIATRMPFSRMSERLVSCAGDVSVAAGISAMSISGDPTACSVISSRRRKCGSRRFSGDMFTATASGWRSRFHTAD